jgi:Zonular occludens toxin (Zot)
MSIFYIAGKPGGGKSYLAVYQICEELKSGKGRYIVTNIQLNMAELAAWCHENIKEEVNLAERVRILDDSETGEFWLYEPHRKYEKRRILKFGKREMDVPDFEDRGLPGCLYVIDEVHIYFGAREWQATGSDCTYFLSQHRKMGCDVILVTQHPEQTDKALRRLAQEYMTVRNLSREPVFGFRIANFFRFVRTLNSPTSPNPAPFDAGFIKLRPEVYGKLYDTTAGVGIAGRVSPTIEQRGIHWYWLGVPVGVVLIFFVWLYTHLSLVSGAIHKGFNRAFFNLGTQAMAHTLVPGLSGQHPLSAVLTATVPLVRPSPVFPADMPSPIVPPAPGPKVYCSGYIDIPGCVMVFLSDGRIANKLNNDVQWVCPGKVCVFGQLYDVYTTAQIEKLHPETYDRSAKLLVQDVLTIPSSVGTIDDLSPVVVNPVHDYRENLHDVRTASFTPNPAVAGSSFQR